MVILLSTSAAYFQPDVAVFASIIFGAFAGFFLWNAPDAKIYLGEGGSTIVGYMLGILAVISGAKLAIALLVMAIPLIDMVWVMWERYKLGGISRITKGDRLHLHFVLIDRGWSKWQVLALYIGSSTILASIGLALQSAQKLLFIALILSCILLVFKRINRHV